MCRRSNVVRASPRLTSVRATRAVFTLGVAGAAATATAAGRTAVAVTRGVVFAFDHDAVIVAVVAVNEESEELCDGLLAGISSRAIPHGRLTKVTKNVRVRIMASAQLALSIAQVLLMFTAQGLLL